MSRFRKGQTVAVLNQTLGGKFIVEGKAKLISCYSEDRLCWLVEFPNGDRVQRFVDPQAQTDPDAYAAQLNARVAA